MTAEERSSSRAEREALQCQVEWLSEQVKLLVRAEHALTRSRGELDRQLQRIRRLSEFSLNISGVHSLGEVLEQARSTLMDLFQLDEVALLRPGGSGQPPVAGFAVDVPGVAEPSGPLAALFLAAVAADFAQTLSESPPRRVVWVPLRAQKGGVVAVLVGWTSRTTSHHRDLPRVEHLPFLSLFGDHVTRALDNALLTAELLLSNQRLQQSVLDLERTQAQLVQAQKLEALGRLSGGIAHDFNNLLTLIVNHAELIRPVIQGQDQAVEDLGVIFDAAQRAAAITRRLLAFGRQQEHKREVVDLNALVADSSRLLRRLIGQDVSLQLDLDASIGRIRADPVQLEQVLLNLVVNARDAMPQGGHLTIETRRARPDEFPPTLDTAERIALVISDTGVGIDEATQKQLFEPFFTTKPVGKGTGLGLATVYGLVNQHRGHVSVKSEPGRGTAFTVLLPAAEEPIRADLSLPSARASILIADDEAGIRRMVARVLRASGFAVREARDGHEAFQLAQDMDKFDLLITDVAMPNMSGVELVARLRVARPALPVLFVSGHTFDCLDPSRLTAELDAFLPKPFGVEDLRRAVVAILARQVRSASPPALRLRESSGTVSPTPAALAEG